MEGQRKAYEFRDGFLGLLADWDAEHACHFLIGLLEKIDAKTPPSVDELWACMKAAKEALSRDLVILEDLRKDSSLQIDLLDLFIRAGEEVLADVVINPSVSEAKNRELFGQRVEELKLNRAITLQLLPLLSMIEENYQVLAGSLELAKIDELANRIRVIVNAERELAKELTRLYSVM